MTGISFNQPNEDGAPVAPPPAADDVACDGWWPAVNLLALRDAVKVPSGETQRLRDAVRQAMLEIAGELSAWRADQEALGYADLAAVPARIVVDGQSDFVLRWFRGVYSVVAADLAERSLSSQLSSAGADRVETIRADIDFHQRNVSYAVRDFLGRSRIIAEAI